jgi:hypothetical protein
VALLNLVDTEKMEDIWIQSDEEKFVNLKPLEKYKARNSDETQIRISLPVNPNAANQNNYKKDWIIIGLDRLRQQDMAFGDLKISVCVKNEDMKRTAVIMSSLIICNKTDLDISMHISKGHTLDMVHLKKDKLVPISCRDLTKAVKMISGDKCTQGWSLETLHDFNQKKPTPVPTGKPAKKNLKNGGPKKPVLLWKFNSPDNKVYMVKLSSSTVDGLKALTICPSFKIMNLLPIEFQYILKAPRWSSGGT